MKVVVMFGYPTGLVHETALTGSKTGIFKQLKIAKQAGLELLSFQIIKEER